MFNDFLYENNIKSNNSNINKLLINFDIEQIFNLIIDREN